MERKRLAATIREWVDVRLDRRSDIVAWGAAGVTEQMDTADLFMAHAESIMEIPRTAEESGERDAWQEALRAVCDELGQRIDAARFDGQEKL